MPVKSRTASLLPFPDIILCVPLLPEILNKLLTLNKSAFTSTVAVLPGASSSTHVQPV